MEKEVFELEFFVLASGSKGNSVVVQTNDVNIMIDCGLAKRTLKSKLEEINLSVLDIDILLITHNHGDHDRAIGLFEKEIIFCGKDTVMDIPNSNILINNQNYNIHGIEITALSISHDTVNPMAYIIKGDESLLYMTDTGYVSQKNQECIRNLEYYIFESNHDIEMLMASQRPDYLKKRILGDLGHLENKYAARILADVIGEKTKEIVLAHLSEEANSPQKALESITEVFSKYDVNFTNIKIATQHDVIKGGK